MKIADGIYMSSNPISGPLRTVNCYLLTDGGETFLFDTGWSKELATYIVDRTQENEGWDMLLELFKEANRDISQLSGIIVSHFHPDHSGFVSALQEMTGAPCITTHWEVKENKLLADRSGEWLAMNRNWYVKNGVPEKEADSMVYATPHYISIPDSNLQLVNDGDIISIGSQQWQVVWTPGHSWGHICLFEKNKGIVLTGDHILAHDTPVVMAIPSLYALRSNPLGGYLWSVNRMKDVKAQIALTGHGAIIDNFPEIVEKRCAHHSIRYDDVMESLQNGEQDAYQVACTIPFVGRKKRLPELRLLDRWLAFTETVSHLRSLEDRGLVAPVIYDDVIKWRLTGEKVGVYDGTDPRLKPISSLGILG